MPIFQKHRIHEPLLNVTGFEKFTNFNFTEENLGASGKRGVAIFANSNLDAEVVHLKARVKHDMLGQERMCLVFTIDLKYKM